MNLSVLNSILGHHLPFDLVEKIHQTTRDLEVKDNMRKVHINLLVLHRVRELPELLDMIEEFECLDIEEFEGLAM